MINSKLQELIKLSNENPNLEVKFLCGYDVAAEDYGYWSCNIIKIEKDIYLEENRIYIGEDDILDELSDRLGDEEDNKNIHDDEFDKKVNELYDN